jgi:hypothetical protein
MPLKLQRLMNYTAIKAPTALGAYSQNCWEREGTQHLGKVNNSATGNDALSKFIRQKNRFIVSQSLKKLAPSFPGPGVSCKEAY